MGSVRVEGADGSDFLLADLGAEAPVSDEPEEVALAVGLGGRQRLAGQPDRFGHVPNGTGSAVQGSAPG